MQIQLNVLLMDVVITLLNNVHSILVLMIRINNVHSEACANCPNGHKR